MKSLIQSGDKGGLRDSPLHEYLSPFSSANKLLLFSSVPDLDPDPPDSYVFGLPDPDPLVRGIIWIRILLIKQNKL